MYPEITITFLGTGTSSGVPMIGCNCETCLSTDARDKRLRTSIKVETSNTVFVIDATPDFRYQMLRTQTNRLDAIVFTHPHKDHIGGIDDVRPYNFFAQKPMQLFANGFTGKAIKNEMHYAFSEKSYPGVPKLELIEINGEDSFFVGDVELKPINVWHLHMPVLGFRMGKFTYITDANKIEDSEKQKIIGTEVLVLNALRLEPHISHFTLQEAVDLAIELNIPKVYFTHISHQLGKYVNVNKTLPSNMQLAYDGLKFVV